MGIFNPDAFVQAVIEEEVSTEITPCPEGEWQLRVVKLDPRVWVKKDDPTKSGVALDVLYEVVSQEALEEAGVHQLFVKGGIPLELAEDGTSLAKGKGVNVALGKFLNACGCNKPGMSLETTIGQVILGSVTHDLVDDTIFARVKKLAALS